MVTRREFLRRSPLVILAFLVMPGPMLRWLQKQPVVRTIPFRIEERIGTLVYKPEVMQHYSKRITVPSFEIASMPMVSIAEIKQRRFEVVDRKLHLERVP